MINAIFVCIILIITFGAGMYNATVRTTLPDYELAVGLCVDNDGVDYMEINGSYDRLELVVCDNGARFVIPSE